MPRDGSNVYGIPSGTHGAEGTTIESARYNAFVDDVAIDLNWPRPILAGGTGAANARDAMIALQGEITQQVITNYDMDAFLSGSFYSASTATAGPVAAHAFIGICYKIDNANMVIEARDQNDTTVPGRMYVREKKVGVWGAWTVDVPPLPTDLLRSTGNQTTTGGYRFTAYDAGTLTAGQTLTPNAYNGNYQYYTNNAAHTLAAPANDSALDILITNGAAAGVITFSGYTVGSNTGDLLTTTNAHKFIASIRRINGTSTYVIKALQ
jgi:hypothetical protein